MFTKPSRTLSASSTTSTGSADGSSRGLEVFLDPIADNAQDTPGKGRLITPGSKLGGTVSVGSVKDAKALKIQLVGNCTYTVMGKTNRHSVNVYSVAGSPAASAAVTFREVHIFLEQKRLLWEASDAKQVHEPAEYPFSFDLPRHKTCSCPCATYTLPPSCDLRSGAGETAVWDRSDISCRYAIYATMERKGFLKRDIRVKIPLTLKDDSPPDYANQEISRTKSYGTLKYATSGQAPPRIECELSFSAPTEQGDTVQYTISYRMAEAAPEPGNSASASQDKAGLQDDPDLPPSYQAAPAPLLNEISPKVEVTLSRYCKTRPVELARDGEEHRFPGYALVAGKTDPEDTSDASLSSHVRFVRGKIQLPAKEVTLFSCGAEIRHMLNARLVSKALLGPVFLSLPIYLPSTV